MNRVIERHDMALFILIGHARQLAIASLLPVCDHQFHCRLGKLSRLKRLTDVDDFHSSDSALAGDHAPYIPLGDVRDGQLRG